MKQRGTSKNSFVLYTDQRDVIEDLSYEEKGMLLDALFEYVSSGTVPQFADRGLLVAFKMFKVSIERDTEKYNNICRKRKEAIKKRWNIQKNTSEYNSIQTIQKNTKHTDNDSDSENDSDNGILEPKGSMDNNKINKHPKGCMSHNDPPTPHTFREKVMFFFNEKMTNKSIKAIRSIESNRAEMLRGRYKQFGEAAIFEVIEKAAASSFLNGNNKRGWIATFDWLIRPNNFAKVLDGNFDDKVNATQGWQEVTEASNNSEEIKWQSL